MARFTKRLNNTNVSKQCRIWIKTHLGYIENDTEPKRERARMQWKRAEMKKKNGKQPAV